MAVTRATVRTAMRFRWRDITSPYRIADTYFNDWINRGHRRLAAKYMFIERTAGIVTDGTRYEYDLTGSAADDVHSNYLAFKSVRHFEYGDIARTGMAQIDDAEETEDYSDDSYPSGYDLFDDKIHFDRPPLASTEILTDDEDRLFTTTTGNWAALAGGTLSVVTGTMRITCAGTSSNLANLDYYDISVGKYYVLQLSIKHGGAWAAGDVRVTIDGNTKTIAQASVSGTSTTYVLKFRARSTDGTITITTSATPTATNKLDFDNFSLMECTTIFKVYVYPDDMDDDNDVPTYPLNILDRMLIAASMAEAADDHGDTDLSKKAEIEMLSLHDEFSQLIDRKGKTQSATIVPHRL